MPVIGPYRASSSPRLGGYDWALAKRPPTVPWRVKRLSLSVSSEAGWYSIPKDAARNGKNPRLQGAGQVMQEAEYSVPLERLAGIMHFQGLRKPQALPGVLASVSIKTLPRLCRGA